MNDSDMKVAILCGGMGSRLGEITKDRPKSLVEVAGEPFLAHQLRLLRLAGLRRVVLLCGHKGAMIWNAFGAGAEYGVDLEYSFDDAQPLGTGGAIVQALPLLGEAFYVLYGDSYLQIDYRSVGLLMEQKDCLGVVTVNSSNYGNIMLDAEGEWVLDYQKGCMPALPFIDIGWQAFRAEAFSDMAGAFDLGHLQRSLAGKLELAAYHCQQDFYEIGTPFGLSQLNDLLRPSPKRDR